MTVAARASTISYIEDGSTTAFAVPFRYAAPTTITAVRRFADGSAAELAYGTDYSMSAAPTDAGGTATVSAPAIAGTVIVFFRETPRSQQARYPTNDRFPAALTEGALDVAMLVDQEQDDKIARSLLLPEGETAAVLPGAVDRAGQVLAFDAAGAPTLYNLAAISVDGSTIFTNIADDGVWSPAAPLLDDGAWG